MSRGSVIRACDRLGIPSEGPGRRRGRPLRAVPPAGQVTGEIVLTGTALGIITRFREDQKRGDAPTDELLARRIRAYSEAKLNGDQFAYEDALLDIASAAGLIHQHSQRLRKAS